MDTQSFFTELSLNNFRLMFRNRELNLEPGFQRKSVWSLTDRRRLIQSIVSFYPLPSIFLYNRSHRGRLVYDVIDGKQRLETVFMFMGLGRFKRYRFDAKLNLGDGLNWYGYKEICRNFPQIRANFDSYKVQTIEVTGDLFQIIDVFVRINSTGKRLTTAEKRHARFYESDFLKEAEKLVSKYNNYLRREKILSQAELDRMRGTELFAELLMSIQNAGPINKKISLDRAIGNDRVNGNTLRKLVNEFKSTMNLIRRMFPNIRQVRFHNTVEFYSLFLLVWEMHKEKFILINKKRNKIAFQILKNLSNGVDRLREQLRKVKPAKTSQRLYAEYLITVQGNTDSLQNRQARHQILKNLLFSLYERKDEKRLFTPEQRRIIWNSEEKKICGACGRALKWEDFAVDHIIAYTKGGRTSLKNAKLLCKSCNSKKGAR